MADSKLDQIKEGYVSLFFASGNPTAKHLVKQMYLMHDELIKKAQKSSDPNESFGLLKQASGIIKVLDHIKTNTGKELGRG